MKIFVQIASYRDPQLTPTIEDCLNKSKHPNNLSFGICWQHGYEEIFDKFKNNKQFKVIDIPYRQSQGVCWARYLIQKLYNNEDFTLQLDSHHRFIQDWDEKLIEMFNQCQKNGSEKPILTGYIPSFDPEDLNAFVQTPWKMNFDKFIPEGAVFFIPAVIENFERLSSPIRTRFLSAHFLFTLGKFCKEVLYDPNYYFHGEEISMAVRAFTRGYDLYHPHKIIAWHEYTRKGRIKHWDDHIKTYKIEKPWYQRNVECHKRNRILFGMDNEEQNIDFGDYGFGNIRTVQDYEKYAGINFKLRGVQKYTLEHNDPPNPYIYSSDEEWVKSFIQDKQLLQTPAIPYKAQTDSLQPI